MMAKNHDRPKVTSVVHYPKIGQMCVNVMQSKSRVPPRSSFSFNEKLEKKKSESDAFHFT